MIKDITKSGHKSVSLITLFGLIPIIPKDDKNTIFNFSQALYWGRNKKLCQKAWTEDGEDQIPNEINVFSMRKNISETGTGSNPFEAFTNALNRIHIRRIKRGADFIRLLNGTLLKNGVVFYYTLGVEVFKIERAV